MRPKLRTEQEIMKNWKGTKPVVSICCLAYNHESYIEDALEGFLIQKTDFPFEVLIHDDASTDRTADIIREYEAAYPHIIKPIYQKENQYSKHIDICSTFLFPKTQGKYIALCEGDDYWINSSKLSLQVKSLERNQNINICFHAAKTQKNNKFGKNRNFHGNKTVIFTFEKTTMGGGGFMPTESIMFRSKSIPLYINFMKKNNSGIGDLYLQIICAWNKGSLYLPIIGSVHRVCSKKSWTERIYYDYTKRIIMLQKVAYEINRLQNFLPTPSHITLTQLEAELLFQASTISIILKNFDIYTLLYTKSTHLTHKINNKDYLVISKIRHNRILLYVFLKIKILLIRLLFLIRL